MTARTAGLTRTLACPECRQSGIKGSAHIGNRRNKCGTCNAFAQAVMRRTRAKLKALHEDEYRLIHAESELEEYRKVLAKVDARLGITA